MSGMGRRGRAAWAAGILGAAALALAACDDSTVQRIDRCAGVTCESPLECDPGDGACKCGGAGGIRCLEGGECSGGECVYACGGASCSSGMALDPSDCHCRCGGPGGPECAPGEVCDASLRRCLKVEPCAGVECAGGTTCDPADGVCKCGGVLCETFESCDQGLCRSSPCAGVTCTGGARCDEADGKCKCGERGMQCVFGEVCGCPTDAPCGEAERECRYSTLCAGKACQGGTTCDPADGRCRCGGPGGPICGEHQSCDVLDKACFGGDRCAGVVCAGGLACDPEDGVCKCGGLNGEVCASNQRCSKIAGASRCITPCDPRLQRCEAGLACYFDIYARQAYCQPKGDMGEGAACTTAPECKPSYHCQQQPYQAGVCRMYCNKANGPAGCPDKQDCFQLDGADANVGACDEG